MSKNGIDLNEMHSVMWEEIQKLRNEETTPASVNAINGMCSTTLRSIKLQMEYAKARGEIPSIPAIETARSGRKRVADKSRA